MPFDIPARNEQRRRRSEAMSWCSSKLPIRDPQRDWRTPGLRPRIAEHGNTFEELNAVVSALAVKRRGLLAGLPKGEDERGRILICEFYMSIDSGESEHESHGFFDISDRPPWDTWMFCVQRKAVAPSSPEPFDVELLASWVPESLVALVDAGIRCNPYDCIYWASEADLAEWGLSE